MCVIIDAFHFQLADSEAANAAEQPPASAVADSDEAGAASASDADEEKGVMDLEEKVHAAADRASAAKEIQASLVKRVLPTLQAQLVRLLHLIHIKNLQACENHWYLTDRVSR